MKRKILKSIICCLLCSCSKQASVELKEVTITYNGETAVSNPLSSEKYKNVDVYYLGTKNKYNGNFYCGDMLKITYKPTLFKTIDYIEIDPCCVVEMTCSYAPGGVGGRMFVFPKEQNSAIRSYDDRFISYVINENNESINVQNLIKETNLYGTFNEYDGDEKIIDKKNVIVKAVYTYNPRS